MRSSISAPLLLPNAQTTICHTDTTHCLSYRVSRRQIECISCLIFTFSLFLRYAPLASLGWYDKCALTRSHTKNSPRGFLREGCF